MEQWETKMTDKRKIGNICSIIAILLFIIGISIFYSMNEIIGLTIVIIGSVLVYYVFKLAPPRIWYE